MQICSLDPQSRTTIKFKGMLLDLQRKWELINHLYYSKNQKETNKYSSSGGFYGASPHTILPELTYSSLNRSWTVDIYLVAFTSTASSPAVPNSLSQWTKVISTPLSGIMNDILCFC
ncbi:hypothetical protein MLD38_024572 [Melastoma candidum]|uniref:Uncharacterized protein n=1 Tax=Melastoma candidum TaxID=119954 RepID=A0ACB9NSQ5_9MYRT|nr:hypothetical protein MLD38_024572 [Melastoma candidum]